jgi:hypothetical protein
MQNSNWNKPLVLRPKETHIHVDVTMKKRKRFSFWKMILWILLIGVLLLATNVAVQIFKNYKSIKSIQTSAQILQAVGKEMILPTDEQPVITTVTNPDEINYQPFFMNALAGDQLIMYSKAKKAILYRPIIEATALQ